MPYTWISKADGLKVVYWNSRYPEFFNTQTNKVIKLPIAGCKILKICSWNFFLFMKPKASLPRIKIPPLIPFLGRFRFFHILTAHCSKTYVAVFLVNGLFACRFWDRRRIFIAVRANLCSPPVSPHRKAKSLIMPKLKKKMFKFTVFCPESYWKFVVCNIDHVSLNYLNIWNLMFAIPKCLTRI